LLISSQLYVNGFASCVVAPACTGLLTVIVHVDVSSPSSVVAVIIASPNATAVTFPFSSTVAISSLLLVHVTFLFVAFSGLTFAINSTVSPISNIFVVGFTVTPSTFTV